MPFFSPRQYSHSFVLLRLVLWRKKNKSLVVFGGCGGGVCGMFCPSAFFIKMINADLTVMLVEIGRETFNINQTLFFIIVYLTSLFPPCRFIPLLSFGSSRHRREILCVKIYRTVSLFYLLIL